MAVSKLSPIYKVTDERFSHMTQSAINPTMMDGAVRTIRTIDNLVEDRTIVQYFDLFYAPVTVEWLSGGNARHSRGSHLTSHLPDSSSLLPALASNSLFCIK